LATVGVLPEVGSIVSGMATGGRDSGGVSIGDGVGITSTQTISTVVEDPLLDPLEEETLDPLLEPLPLLATSEPLEEPLPLEDDAPELPLLDPLELPATPLPLLEPFPELETPLPLLELPLAEELIIIPAGQVESTVTSTH